MGTVQRMLAEECRKSLDNRFYWKNWCRKITPGTDKICEIDVAVFHAGVTCPITVLGIYSAI